MKSPIDSIRAKVAELFAPRNKVIAELEILVAAQTATIDHLKKEQRLIDSLPVLDVPVDKHSV